MDWDCDDGGGTGFEGYEVGYLEGVGHAVVEGLAGGGGGGDGGGECFGWEGGKKGKG